MWGQPEIVLGSMWGQFGADLGSIWGRFGVDLKSSSPRSEYSVGLFFG